MIDLRREKKKKESEKVGDVFRTAQNQLRENTQLMS